MGGGLRSSGIPHEGYADLIINDGPGFHSDMPVSELTERDTRAIKASGVSSAPPVAKTIDGKTHETRPTPTELWQNLLNYRAHMHLSLSNDL